MERFGEVADDRVRAALQATQTRVTVLCEDDGTIVWASDSITRLLGHRPADIVGTPVFRLYAGEGAADSGNVCRRAVADPASATDPVSAVASAARVRCADGSYRHVESRSTVMLGDPEVRGILLEWTPIPDPRILTDAIDSVASGRSAAESIARIVSLAEAHLFNTDVGIVVAGDGGWTPVVMPGGRDGETLTQSMAPPSDARWTSEFVVGSGLDTWAGDGLQTGFRTVTGSDGSILAAFVFVGATLEQLRPDVTRGEHVCDVACCLAALTLEADRQRVEMFDAGETDPLTGLATRAGLARHFADRADDHVQALVVSAALDDIEPVNDRFGRAAGDQLLRETGRRLRESLRDADIACRSGGDEFVAVCFAPWGEDDAAAVAMRLAGALARPIALELHDGSVTSMTVGISMGTTLGPADDLDALMAESEESLHAAQRRRQARRGR